MTCTAMARVALLSACLILPASGEPDVTRLISSGGPLDHSSSLHFKWIVVNDASFPATLGLAGIRSEWSWDFYECKEAVVSSSDSLHAFEIRFLLVDVWGEQMNTLATTKVVDVEANGTHRMKQLRWSNQRDNDLYASIGYVARVRLQSGRVVNFDEELALEEARKLAAEIRQ